jgi:multicomponent K+:H+ antiporter subunit E
MAMTGRAWLPHPVLSAVLLTVWLLLANSIHPGHVVLGAIIAFVIPLFTRVFWPQSPRIRRPLILLSFATTVAWDIVIANLEVAALILGPRKKMRPRFVQLPLELQDEFAIAILANTISLTPGTVTADVAADRKSLFIHCLHVHEEAELIDNIKRRYERRLKEIFEC